MMSYDALIERIVRHADARHAPGLPVETEIAGLSFVRCRAPTALEAMCYKPLLCVVLQGRKVAYLGRSRVNFAAGQSLIVSFDLPTASRVMDAREDAPYVALALELDLGVVRSLIDEVGEASLPETPAKAIVSGAADAALIEAMGRLFDLTDKPLERRVLAPLLIREIHFRSLMARHGAMLRTLARRDSHASRIMRALSHIRTHYAEPLRVGDLAEAAGMSVSSFHEHFRAVMASTPLRYQKDLRLLEARDLLIEGALPVTTVAFEVGYESPTQFSREYARKFGRPPSADRKKVTVPA